MSLILRCMQHPNQFFYDGEDLWDHIENEHSAQIDLRIVTGALDTLT